MWTITIQLRYKLVDLHRSWQNRSNDHFLFFVKLISSYIPPYHHRNKWKNFLRKKSIFFFFSSRYGLHLHLNCCISSDQKYKGNPCVTNDRKSLEKMLQLGRKDNRCNTREYSQIHIFRCNRYEYIISMSLFYII